MFRDNSVDFFLEELAGSKPAPGGGSASANVSAFGAAMAEMVCNFTIGKKKYADVEAEVKEILERSEALREKLTAAIDLDTTAYNMVTAALHMPKETGEEKTARKAALQEATIGAMEVPRGVVRDSLALLEELPRLVEIGNRNLVTDAGCAALCALAGLRGAMLNVLINLSGLDDKDLAANVRKEMDDALERAKALEEKVMESVEADLQP